MALKKIIGDVLRRLGYQAVPLEFLHDLALIQCLKKLFETQRIDAVLDVGANRGQYARLLRHGVGFGGTIFSFEPVGELNVQLANAAAGDPRWHVFPFALGSAPAELTMNVMKARTLSSLLAPDASRTDRFAESNQPERTEVVVVRRLDDVWPELQQHARFERPYLKLDTQGYDLEVVAGACAVMPNFVALQHEASVLPAYLGMPDWREAIDTLSKLGFELSGTYPVTRDEQLRLIEFDSVMVNTPRILKVAAEMH